MKWKVEIMQVVDAPDTYSAEQVMNSVKRQFGTDVVRVERIDDAAETSINANTATDENNTDSNTTTS